MYVAGGNVARGGNGGRGGNNNGNNANGGNNNRGNNSGNGGIARGNNGNGGRGGNAIGGECLLCILHMMQSLQWEMLQPKLHLHLHEKTLSAAGMQLVQQT